MREVTNLIFSSSGYSEYRTIVPMSIRRKLQVAKVPAKSALLIEELVLCMQDRPEWETYSAYKGTTTQSCFISFPRSRMSKQVGWTQKQSDEAWAWVNDHALIEEAGKRQIRLNIPRLQEYLLREHVFVSEIGMLGIPLQVDKSASHITEPVLILTDAKRVRDLLDTATSAILQGVRDQNTYNLLNSITGIYTVTAEILATTTPNEVISYIQHQYEELVGEGLSEEQLRLVQDLYPAVLEGWHNNNDKEFANRLRSASGSQEKSLKRATVCVRQMRINGYSYEQMIQCAEYERQNPYYIDQGITLTVSHIANKIDEWRHHGSQKIHPQAIPKNVRSTWELVVKRFPRMVQHRKGMIPVLSQLIETYGANPTKNYIKVVEHKGINEFEPVMMIDDMRFWKSRPSDGYEPVLHKSDSDAHSQSDLETMYKDGHDHLVSYKNGSYVWIGGE